MTQPARAVLETKHTLDGRAQTFSCSAVLLSERLAVVRFEHSGAREVGGFRIPAGSHTLGFFWRWRPYNCYRMAGPDGRVIAYRFDVVDRVRISADHVSYHDLLLDIWVSPAGETSVEDEDEVEAATAAGLLSRAQRERIERTQRWLIGSHRRVVAEVEAIVRAL